MNKKIGGCFQSLSAISPRNKGEFLAFENGYMYSAPGTIYLKCTLEKAYRIVIRMFWHFYNQSCIFLEFKGVSFVSIMAPNAPDFTNAFAPAIARVELVPWTLGASGF